MSKNKDSKSSTVIGETRIAELLSNVGSVALTKITASKMSSFKDQSPALLTSMTPQASKEDAKD